MENYLLAKVFDHVLRREKLWATADRKFNCKPEGQVSKILDEGMPRIADDCSLILMEPAIDIITH